MQVPLDHLEIIVQMELQGILDHLDHQDLQDHKKVQVPLNYLEMMGQMELQEILDHLDLQDLQEIQGIQDLPIENYNLTRSVTTSPSPGCL